MYYRLNSIITVQTDLITQSWHLRVIIGRNEETKVRPSLLRGTSVKLNYRQREIMYSTSVFWVKGRCKLEESESIMLSIMWREGKHWGTKYLVNTITNTNDTMARTCAFSQ